MWPHESPWFWWVIAGAAILIVLLAPLFWDRALVRWWQSGQPQALWTWAKRNRGGDHLGVGVVRLGRHR